MGNTGKQHVQVVNTEQPQSDVDLRPVRRGWAEDARRIAAAGDEPTDWLEFGNDDDAALTW